MTIDESLYSYLEANEKYLNLSAIAREVGTNAGNLAKYRSAKKFPERYAVALSNLFIRLDWLQKVELVVKENNKPENKMRIEDERKCGLNHPYERTVIQMEIDAVRAEKIPVERNTVLGRKVWQKEQDKRVEELRMLLG